jgi:hypothetical protein
MLVEPSISFSTGEGYVDLLHTALQMAAGDLGRTSSISQVVSRHGDVRVRSHPLQRSVIEGKKRSAHSRCIMEPVLCNIRSRRIQPLPSLTNRTVSLGATGEVSSDRKSPNADGYMSRVKN